MPPKHDSPYETDHKQTGTMVCDDCRIVQHGGRWSWGGPPPGETHGGLCPACRRIRDRRPAGTIHVPASMLDDDFTLEKMARSVESAEREEHPLERIIDIEPEGDGLLITTTGMHLARRISAHLARRSHQKAHVRYDEQDEVTVDWNE
ncbi:MAG: ATPase [Planctomycetes bacterium]|nr:ATPase [Planctomycetota bacterium]